MNRNRFFIGFIIVIIFGTALAIHVVHSRIPSKAEQNQAWLSKVDSYIESNKPQLAVNLLLREAQTDMQKKNDNAALEKLRLAKQISKYWDVEIPRTFQKLIEFLEKRSGQRSI